MDDGTDPGGAVVQLDQISKRFGGTQALRDVSISLQAGEVHAIVGENGAGKSTLGKVIAGIYHPDSGTVSLDGNSVGRWDPLRAQRQGVVMIAQELALVPELTVEQNVFLGREQHILGVARRNLTERFDTLEALVGFGLNPKQPVGGLRIAEQQKVEIMRSLARDARVIVMDEPTSSLTSHETAQLHTLIRKLTDRGCAVVYVSHFLDAVLGVSDRVTVMRDGQLIRTALTPTETKQSLVEAMLGRELAVSFPTRSPAVDSAVPPLLSVSHLATNYGVEDVSFDVRPGEIVGLLGLVGSGRSETAAAVFGVDRVTAGTVLFDGKERTNGSPRHSVDDRLVLVPEDRHAQGLVLERSVRENMALACPRLFSTLGFINTHAEKKAIQALAERLDIRPPKIELEVSGFSGGNQQKALLGKALLDKPRFVILDEPTRGVDIGAKLTIYELIVQLANEGIGILLISSEHEEIMELSHRAYLLSDGRTIGEIDPTQTTVEEVLYRLFHVDDQQEKAS